MSAKIILLISFLTVLVLALAVGWIRAENKAKRQKGFYEDLYCLQLMAAIEHGELLREGDVPKVLSDLDTFITNSPKTLCFEMKDQPGFDYWLGEIEKYVEKYGLYVDDKSRQCLESARPSTNPKRQIFHNIHILKEHVGSGDES